MEGPFHGQVIVCTALRRPSSDFGLKLPEWMLCTGMSMGRWTSWFGPWCLAGDLDARKFVEAHHEMNPKTEIVEFKILCDSPLLQEKDSEITPNQKT
jgi:hypothetical protein